MAEAYSEVSQRQIEIEKDFAGCVVVSADFARAECGWLDPSLFADGTIGKFWGMVLDGKDPMEAAGDLNITHEAFGWMNRVPNFQMANGYAKAIAKKSFYRYIMLGAQDLARAVQNQDKAEIDSILEVMTSLDDAETVDHRDAEQVAESLINRMERDDLSIPFGIESVDWATAGQERGTMTVWAARTSMGKSALAMEFAEYQALTLGVRVAFFALEMSAEQMMARRVCHKVKNLQGYPASWQDVRAKNIGQEERLTLYALVRAYGERIKGKLDVYDATHFTSKDVERIQRKLRYDVIYIDHGGLLKDKPRRGERWDQLIGRFTLNLHELAKNTYCVVNMIWQLNRETGQRANNRPSLTDLRDSGKIEENADNVILLHRESYWDASKTQEIDPMELVLAKYRDGARSYSCFVGFDLAAQKFTSMKREDVEAVIEEGLGDNGRPPGQTEIPF